MNDSFNYSAIKNLCIEKYIPIGEEKLIKYCAFIDEFKQYVLARPLKNVVKLNHLKSYLGGDALDLVKSYTHGDQINEALGTLQNAYNKPDFVISEVYCNLKKLPSFNTFKDKIKTAKEQVHTLKVSVATLKTL